MAHSKIITLLLVVLWFLPGTRCDAKTPNLPYTQHSQGEAVFAMCHPDLKQIKNIEYLYESNIITLHKIKLIGVYHEMERSDYESARAYVKENNLYWVSFVTIKGDVSLENLFRENQWTEQFKSLFHSTGGIIFTGGADIPPEIYNHEYNLLSKAGTPRRSNYEISLLFHLIGSSRNAKFVPFLEKDNDYVILGICLGSQSMNVAAGGTMVQDIPSEVYGLQTVQQVLKLGNERIHSGRYIATLNPFCNDLKPTFHKIKLKKKSIYLKRMKMKPGVTPYVLTAHHQAYKKLGKDLVITATSMDGKIGETLEHKKYKNVLGVQFHPEYHPIYKKAPHYSEKPGGPLTFNARAFLQKNAHSMIFHLKLWQWFSGALAKK
ncbi:MAG: hypothetical protein GY757_40525 [bacterium]|nr:hypothetical protein [bacterium]